jgi:hypothetical protein
MRLHTLHTLPQPTAHSQTHRVTSTDPERSPGLVSVFFAAPIINVVAETSDIAAACIGLMKSATSRRTWSNAESVQSG